MNCNFCLFFNFFVPKTYSVFQSFRWAIIHMDFVDFPFRTSKLKNSINYIKYKFSHRFGKVCKWLSMYYSKIIIITTIVSIWIILKNLVWTHKDYNFCNFLATWLCIHPSAFLKWFHVVGGERVFVYEDSKICLPPKAII